MKNLCLNIVENAIEGRSDKVHLFEYIVLFSVELHMYMHIHVPYIYSSFAEHRMSASCMAFIGNMLHQPISYRFAWNINNEVGEHTVMCI